MHHTLLSWIKGAVPPPFRTFLVLTERCNLRCPMCCFGEPSYTPTPPDKELTEAQLMRLADEGLALGIKEWQLLGGEPFVRKKTALALIERLEAGGAWVEVTTNGTLLDEREIKALVAAPLNLLNVSLDGATAEVHDAFRGQRGSFAKVVRLLELIRAEKAARGNPRHPWIQILATVGRDNFGELPALVDLAADFRVDRLSLQPINDVSAQSGGMLIKPADQARVKSRLDEALRRAAARGLATNLANFLDELIPTAGASMGAVLLREAARVSHPFLRSPCFVPFTQLVVMQDGEIRPCWMIGGAGLPRYGEAALGRIWDGPGLRKFRQDLLSGRLAAPCEKCCLGNVLEARRLRVETLVALGEYAAAERLIAEGLAAEPWEPHLVRERFVVLHRQHRDREAEEFCRAAGQNGASPYLFAMLLSTFCELGRPDLNLTLWRELVNRPELRREPALIQPLRELALAIPDGPVRQALAGGLPRG